MYTTMFTLHIIYVFVDSSIKEVWERDHNSVSEAGPKLSSSLSLVDICCHLQDGYERRQTH